MLDLLSQIGVTLFGLPALGLMQLHGRRWRRAGVVLGLLGQPAWYCQMVIHEQWGMLPVFCGYTAVWGFGFWNNWVRKGGNGPAPRGSVVEKLGVSASEPADPAGFGGERRAMLLLRCSIDQTLSRVRDELDSWPESRRGAFIDFIADAADGRAPSMSEDERLAARMQYVAVQMVALDRAEARAAAGGA